MNNTELMPCPFCGGEAHIIEPARYGTSWGVRCECGAFLGFEHTEAEAIAAWNIRNERTCINSESEIYPGGMVFVCSECESMSVEGQPNYCPNCGAKVVGK